MEHFGGRLELLSFGTSAIVVAVLAIISLPMLAVFTVSHLLADPAPSQVPFDPALWRDQEHWTTGTRAHMVEDLRTNYLVTGLPREDVEDILGPSEQPSSVHGMTYTLRDRTSYGPDAEYLSIFLDEEQRVVRTVVFSRGN